MKYILLFIIFFAGGTTPLFAQEVHHYKGLNNLPPSLRFLKDRIEQRKKFTDLTDSLFMKGSYDRLIEVCNKNLDSSNVKDLAQYNLIGAYYQVGKIDSSKAIIKDIEQNSGNRYSAIDQLFSPHSISAISYMDNEKHRNEIEDYIIRHYRKENYSKIEDGIVLMKLIHYDQWIRRSNFLSKKQIAFINWPDRKFRKADNKQKKKLYEFLKKKQWPVYQSRGRRKYV